MRERNLGKRYMPKFDPKLSVIKEKRKRLEAVFRAYEGMACVYLLGSCVKEVMTTGSDLDFAVLATDEAVLDSADLAYRIEKSLGFVAPVELIVLNHQRLLFQYTVISEGKIVYEAVPEVRVDFEVRVLKEVAELEDSLRFAERYRISGLLRRMGYETARRSEEDRFPHGQS